MAFKLDPDAEWARHAARTDAAVPACEGCFKAGLRRGAELVHRAALAGAVPATLRIGHDEAEGRAPGWQGRSIMVEEPTPPPTSRTPGQHTHRFDPPEPKPMLGPSPATWPARMDLLDKQLGLTALRVEALGRAVEALRNDTAAERDDLRDRIEALAEIAGARNGAAWVELSERCGALAGRLEKLEAGRTEAECLAVDGTVDSIDGRLSDLAARLDEIEKRGVR